MQRENVNLMLPMITGHLVMRYNAIRYDVLATLSTIQLKVLDGGAIALSRSRSLSFPLSVRPSVCLSVYLSLCICSVRSVVLARSHESIHVCMYKAKRKADKPKTFN